MSVNGVNGNSYNYNSYQATSVQSNAAAIEEAEKQAAETQAPAQKEDGFVKTNYKPDTDKINEMKADLKNNMQAFKQMVQGMVGKQANVAGQASGLGELYKLLNVSEEEKLAAQEAISEDGYWGVEQTSQRIFDFAIALSGGDPAKAETLRDAVQKGFEAAEKVWGGKLPEISQQTYDSVMKKFDDWVNGGATDVAEEA